MGVKKEKALSAEQLAKKEAKRLKEIAKLEKEKNKSRGLGYFACFLFIITVVYMVDELTSQIGSQMQTIIAMHYIITICKKSKLFYKNFLIFYKLLFILTF